MTYKNKLLVIYAFSKIIASAQLVGPAHISKDSLNHILEWDIEGLRKNKISSISIDPAQIKISIDSKKSYT